MPDLGMQVLFQGNNLLRILQGLGVTIGISILSVLLSMIFGTVMGIIMTSHSRVIRFLTRFYLEFIRIMPQLVLLFIVYFGLARNFNIVPVALLEMRDQYGVIKAQLPIALIMLVLNILLMYYFI